MIEWESDPLQTYLCKKLSTAMIDPSLLVHRHFWLAIEELHSQYPSRGRFLVPYGIMGILDRDLSRYYAGSLGSAHRLNAEEIVRKCYEFDKYLDFFSWKDYRDLKDKEFLQFFEPVRNELQRSKLPRSIQEILLDELVFMATKSAILSRLRKTFPVLLRKFRIPLIDLTELVPLEWKLKVKGIKKIVQILTYIATLDQVEIRLGSFIGPAETVYSGVVIFLIDP
ncbi:MAG: hypothetical protein QW087_07775 [Methanomassiliicoccales archaeon]